MDPLSITASAIAVVGAIRVSADCLRKLAAIPHAPAELSLLREEVQALHELLMIVAAVADELEGQDIAGNLLYKQVHDSLEQSSSRAALALNDLGRIVGDYSSKVQGGKSVANKLNAFNWLQQGRKRTAKILAQVTDIKLNIITILSAHSR